MPLRVGLEGYWPCHETGADPGDLIDFTAYASNGVETGGVIPSASGLVVTSRDLELGSSQFFLVSDPVDGHLDFGNEDFTLSCWVKKESSPATGMRLVHKGTSGAAANTPYSLYWDTALNRFGFDVSNGTTQTTRTFASLGTPSNGVWYHLVAGHDSVGNTVWVRANDAATDTAAHTAGCFNASVDFRIGSGRTAGGTPQEFYDGLICEIGVWRKKLSAAEITYLYNLGAGITWPLGSAGSQVVWVW